MPHAIERRKFWRGPGAERFGERTAGVKAAAGRRVDRVRRIAGDRRLLGAMVGIERIRAVVIEDSEGVALSLDAAMQASIDAAYDPWKEATAPKTANQFVSLIPVEGA